MTSKKRHSRRSIRLRAYDYTQPGGYFVTIGTFRMRHTLARIDQGQVHLSPIGNIVHEEWFITARLRPYIRLEPEEFVIMPNHIHGIIWIVEAAPNPDFEPGSFKLLPDSLGAVIGQFKSAVTKRVNRLLSSRVNVWHTNYYEHIVRDDHDLERIQQYIRNNPTAWTRNRQRPLRQRPHSGDMIMQSHPVLQ